MKEDRAVTDTIVACRKDVIALMLSRLRDFDARVKQASEVNVKYAIGVSDGYYIAMQDVTHILEDWCDD